MAGPNLPQIIKPTFNANQQLPIENLEREQNFQIAWRKFQLSLLWTPGILTGLKVQAGATPNQVTLTAGAAVDAQGRIVLLTDRLLLNTSQIQGSAGSFAIPVADSSLVSGTLTWVLAIAFNEEPVVGGSNQVRQTPTLYLAGNGAPLGAIPLATVVVSANQSTLIDTTVGISAAFTSVQIPNLDASKITSGTLAPTLLPANITFGQLTTTGALTAGGTLSANGGLTVPAGQLLTAGGGLTVAAGQTLSARGPVNAAGPIGLGTSTPISGAMLHVINVNPATPGTLPASPPSIIGGTGSPTPGYNQTGWTLTNALEARAAQGTSPPAVVFHHQGTNTIGIVTQDNPRGLHVTQPTNEANTGLFVDGSVGIGTTTPGATLEVVGNVKVSGTALSWFYGDVMHYGQLGIGNTAPTFPLHVSATATKSVSNYGYLTSAGMTGKYTVANSFAYSIRAEGSIQTGGEVHCTSDARLKELVDALSPQTSLAAVRRLRPVQFRWKPGTGKGDTVIAGFFAQEAAQAIPEAVSFGEGAQLADEHSLSYNQIVAYNTSALQALSQQNEALAARVAELEKKMRELTATLRSVD